MMPGGGAAIAQPKMPDPVRLPDPEDPELLAIRRERMSKEFNERQGRESTQLSSDAGARAYSRTTLG